MTPTGKPAGVFLLSESDEHFTGCDLGSKVVELGPDLWRVEHNLVHPDAGVITRHVEDGDADASCGLERFRVAGFDLCEDPERTVVSDRALVNAADVAG